MNWIVSTYVAYLAISIALTVWVVLSLRARRDSVGINGKKRETSGKTGVLTR